MTVAPPAPPLGKGGLGGIKAECRMISFHLTGDALWQRMERAVQKVQERLERTAATLEQAGVPYAIIGGNAVRAWVAQADEAAVQIGRAHV